VSAPNVSSAYVVGRVAADADQVGSRTRIRFDYQDLCVCVWCGRSAVDRSAGRDRCRACDRFSHLAGERPAELVSVKSREPSQRGDVGWTWHALDKQGVLRHLYEWWDRNGRSATTTVWTNAGLEGAAIALASIPTHQQPYLQHWRLRLPHDWALPGQVPQRFSPTSTGRFSRAPTGGDRAHSAGEAAPFALATWAVWIGSHRQPDAAGQDHRGRVRPIRGESCTSPRRRRMQARMQICGSTVAQSCAVAQRDLDRT